MALISCFQAKNIYMLITKKITIYGIYAKKNYFMFYFITLLQIK